VKPGTVIEYRYTHESTDYFSLYSFKFQEEIPVMRCTFRVEFPEYFDYKFVTGGDFHNIIYRYERRKISFGSSFMDGFEGSWTGSNIPAFREEPFSTGSEDYYSQIGFELSKINIPGYYFEDVSPTYPKLSELLMKRTDFGGYLSQSSAVKKKAEEIKAQGGSETEILRRIFTYISEYMMWNGSSHFTSTESMSKIYKEARGNSADINLMLLAMLRIAGLQADPVIFSTRENGMVNPVFAIIQRFNNVAVVASADGKQYIIDATDPLRPFNMLPLECLNGEGWLVRNSGGSWVDLTNGEHYSQAIDLDLALDENGVMTGKSTAIYESYDAWQVRKLCSLFGTETYRDYVQSDRSNLKISDLHLENLGNLEEPVIEKITFTIPDASHTNQTIIYLNPVVSDRVESNEFYADERISMIDLACCSVRKYSCTITIPDGWKVAELPQSVRLNLDGGGAVFSYDIKAEGRTIKLESEISFTTTTYFPEKYNSIRNFYSSIIRKQSEVVILTKEI